LDLSEILETSPLTAVFEKSDFRVLFWSILLLSKSHLLSQIIKTIKWLYPLFEEMSINGLDFVVDWNEIERSLGQSIVESPFVFAMEIFQHSLHLVNVIRRDVYHLHTI
jgi:hypothetical protein